MLTPLSVLDLAVVGPEDTPERVLRDVVDVARTAERHGYHRFWVAEHHAMPGTAGSSPAVLLGYLAANTSTLRIGSGGVMLPYHVPLVVAEQFAVLQALSEGRVDLGVGRSGGANAADPRDRALRLDATRDFGELIDELIGFLHGRWPAGHPFHAVELSPKVTAPPDIHVLGSSENGAGLAAARGLPFVYGHHLGRGKAKPAAVARYRAEFAGARPSLIVSVGVVCADDPAVAERAAMARAMWEIQRHHPNVTGAELRDAANRALVTNSVIYGDPVAVRDGIHRLAASLDADEIMVVPFDLRGAGRSRTLRSIAHADTTGDRTVTDRQTTTVAVG